MARNNSKWIYLTVGAVVLVILIYFFWYRSVPSTAVSQGAEIVDNGQPKQNVDPRPGIEYVDTNDNKGIPQEVPKPEYL